MAQHEGPRHYAIEVRELSYRYRRKIALDQTSFTVREGAIHGFVGPNGAGKTTTLRVLATLLRPRQGIVSVFGHDIIRDYKTVRRQIGFMPDHFSMYRQMTVFEYLDFFAAAYGLPLKQRNSVIADVLSLTDMTVRGQDLIKSLSRGMQQRVSLARVLVHDPSLLLLDEPASGLDPRARIELMDIIRELRRLGKTIFISSHILSELAELCDSVTIIDRGVIRFSGTMKDLTSHEGGQNRYLLHLSDGKQIDRDAIVCVPGVTEAIPLIEENGFVITFDPTHTDSSGLLRALLDAGIEIHAFRPDIRHLNQAFMELTEAGIS